MNSNDASLKHTRQILSFAFMVTAAAASLILAIGGSAQSPTANVAIMVNGNMSYGNMASYSPTPEPPKTTIRGRAVYEDTGRPVRRASIMLMNSKGGGRELSAITDNNGAFEVRNATEGRYYAVINSPGVLTPVAYFDFAAASEREGMASGLEEAKTLFDEINVGAGGGTIDVFVRAKRGGAVGGRIMYADGDPAIGVKVEVLRKKDEKYLSIIPNLTEIFAAAMGGSAGGGKTDDRGIYRISGLPPGDYIVRVTEPASHRDSDDRGRGMFGPIGLGVSSLVSTYHPDVSDSKQAAVIKLEAGQEAAEVNITIPERLFQDVLGKVVARGNRQPVRGARISLLRKDDTVSFFDRLNEEGPGSGEATDEQGTFFFKELPPGNYLLKVKPPEDYDRTDYDGGAKLVDARKPRPKFAPTEKEIVITDKALPEIEIEMPFGASIKGTVKTEGNKPLPSSGRIFVKKENGEEIASAFVSTQTYNEGKSTRRTTSEFELDNLPAGKLFLGFSKYDVSEPEDKNDLIYYLKSMKQGAIDLMSAPLDLAEGANISDVQVILATDGGRLKGKVKLKDEEKPAANKLVVLIPAEESKWRAQSLRIFTMTDAKGEFEVAGAPIEYFIIFLQAGERISAINEAWIRARSGNADKVTIKPNSATSANLTAP